MHSQQEQVKKSPSPRILTFSGFLSSTSKMSEVENCRGDVINLDQVHKSVYLMLMLLFRVFFRVTAEAAARPSAAVFCSLAVAPRRSPTYRH